MAEAYTPPPREFPRMNHPARPLFTRVIWGRTPNPKFAVSLDGQLRDRISPSWGTTSLNLATEAQEKRRLILVANPVHLS